MMRHRDVEGSGVPTPFVAFFRDCQELDGKMVPMAGEVRWILPEGPLTFWRGQITRAAYRYAEWQGTPAAPATRDGTVPACAGGIGAYPGAPATRAHLHGPVANPARAWPRESGGGGGWSGPLRTRTPRWSWSQA
jgi:hypothetical protein